MLMLHLFNFLYTRIVNNKENADISYLENK